MARRNRVNVFGLAFLDAMTCGLGAVILLYMVINASTGLRTDRLSDDLRAEVERLEVEVLEGYKTLVELRNSKREADYEHLTAQGLSRRLIEILEQIRLELATYEDATLAQREHLDKLQADLKSLEEDAKRLAASVPEEETPGDKIRTFVGDGDRQYLTGLKVGGKRILILVDTSASMLDETIVNIIRFRNLPPERRIRAEKWQQAVSTVDWLSTQFPRDSQFQIYTFADNAAPLIDGTLGDWLDAGDRNVLEKAMSTLRVKAPEGGTSLHYAFSSIKTLRPRPDNVILLADGLPTRGAQPPKKRTVSGKERMKHFERAMRELPDDVPINVILFPMEGDPLAASAFWKLAMYTEGSFMSPARDWP
ncbi:MAG: VWA domain-containing protein [bacterium]|nr:VWA domain-containing protein [bacterium]